MGTKIVHTWVPPNSRLNIAVYTIHLLSYVHHSTFRVSYPYTNVRYLWTWRDRCLFPQYLLRINRCFFNLIIRSNFTLHPPARFWLRLMPICNLTKQNSSITIIWLLPYHFILSWQSFTFFKALTHPTGWFVRQHPMAATTTWITFSARYLGTLS